MKVAYLFILLVAGYGVYIINTPLENCQYTLCIEGF
jgi:hypothetical protein